MRLVLISPFPAERSALHQLLEDDGHDVSAVATRDQGLEVASAVAPEAVIVDSQVVGLHEHLFVRELCERGIRARVILMCPRVCRASDRNGIVCLTKPIELGQLRQHLQAWSTGESRVA
jgi:DNA-binding response OmpR family regulator